MANSVNSELLFTNYEFRKILLENTVLLICSTDYIQGRWQKLLQ
jgi:hypothetical protein